MLMVTSRLLSKVNVVSEEFDGKTVNSIKIARLLSCLICLSYGIYLLGLVVSLGFPLSLSLLC